MSSIEVKSDWIHLNGEEGTNDFTMSLPQMEKLKHEDEPSGENLGMVGSLFMTSADIDKATVKAQIPLRKLQREARPFYLSVMDDPVMKKMADEGKAQVFTTDVALAVIMAAPRSVASWDIVVQRSGAALFLDVREGSSVFDNIVNETAQEAPEDDKDAGSNMNSMTQLNMEASYINYCYTQQCIDKNEAPEAMQQEGKNGKGLLDAWRNRPKDQEVPHGKAFRYRRFEVDDDNEVHMVVRCEVDAAFEGKDGKKAFVTIKALNEFDPAVSGVNWRQKLDSQRAAVLANELKNNRNKLARWTCQAIIAGVDYLKMGYVSRAHAKDNVRHFVLGTQLMRPADFANQIELKTENMWGIAKAVVQKLFTLQTDNECKFLLLKDPNHPKVNVYKVPADSFDYEEQEEETGEVMDDDDDSDLE